MKKFILSILSILLGLTFIHAQCPTGEINVKISIKTDNYGSETTWSLKHQTDTTVFDSGGPYLDITGGQLYVKNVCIPAGTPVVFEVNDGFGDGMCCSYGNGYYLVEMLGYTVASGGEFGSTEETEFVVDTPKLRDMTVLSLNLMDYISTGNISITGKIKSLGSDTVTSYNINYSVNGAAPVTQTIASQSVAPFTSINFTHPTPYNATASGAYNVKVWASNINGEADLYNDNDTIEGSFVVVSQVPQKYVLIEQATGAWCGYCPDGSVKLAQILAANPNAIGVAIHNADAMAFTDGNTVNTAFASGYPNGYIDRFLFSGLSNIGLSRSLWQAKSNERMLHVSPVSVDVTNTYNSTTRVVNITVSATFYAGLNEELRFNAYIVEDSLSGTGTGWNQSNNYNTTAGHPMQGLGNPIVGYQHRHVVKALLGGPWGTAGSLPVSVTDGNTYTKEYTYTLPANMKEKDIRIIGVVQKYNGDNKNRAILNSKQVALQGFSSTQNLDFLNDIVLFPNPASSNTNLVFSLTEPKNVRIDVYNILGQNVYSYALGKVIEGHQFHSINTTQFTKGMYKLVIHFDNNIVTKSLIIE